MQRRPKQAERTTTYSYSELNRLRSYEDEESKAVYQHDVLGRVTEVTVTYKTATPVFSKTIGYSYDANGRKATYSNAEQQTYSYSYSAHGQLNGLSIPGEGSISLQNFNWLQPQNILYPGGSSLQVVHDGLLRYSSRDLKDPAGNPIQSHSYQYDAVGNITAIAGQDGKADYGYDKLYRLTEAKYLEGDSRTNEAYAYDGVGNRLDKKTSKAELDISQWQYNAHNQLVSHDGIGYRYNADGHLIEKGALQENGSLIQSGSIDHWRYQYDSRERLVEVQKNSQPLVKYAYSPLGQRISKTLLASKQTTYYLYSEEGLVGEYDAQGQLKQEYAYDPTAPWMSQPLFTRAQRSDTQAWSVSYFGTSHLGTPEVAFEKSGEVTWRAKAQAFGETVVGLNTIDNALRFPGQYFDGETGLYQNYFRDYDSGLGRYVESDPIGLAGGLNTFGYAYQNPIANFDPDGRMVWFGIPAWVWFTGGAGVAGVAAVNSGGYAANSGMYSDGNDSIDPTYCPPTTSSTTSSPDPCELFPELCPKEPAVEYKDPRNLNPTQSKNEISGSQVDRMAKDMRANGYDVNKYGPIDAQRVPGSNRYDIIDGHHRAAAANKAGIQNVPVRIWE